MRIYHRLFLISCLFFQTTQVSAQWENMNTGLSMDITGVNFDGNVGFVSGKDGIYYTQSGGIGPTSWMYYSITTSTSDSIIYEQTQFNHCYSTPTIANDAVFFCGRDTVLNRAVIFSIDPTNLSYSLVYTGPTGSSLSHMSYTSTGTRYYAVGDSGLVVSFLSSGSASVSFFPFTDSLIALNFNGSRYAITAGDKLFHGTVSTLGVLSNLYDCSVSPRYVNDLQAYSSTNLNAVGNGHMTATVTCGIASTSNLIYDEFSLNGKAIIMKNANWIIGTDHGVYKNVSNSIEYQPTSNANYINDFGEDAANSNRLFAACKNGVLLRTSNNGGMTKPNVSVNVEGGCLGQSLYVSRILGSAQSSSVQWWIDGALQSSSTFSGTGVLPVGQHVVSLTANNGTYSDSSSVVFQVVDTPNVTFPFTIIDDILCQKEAITVEFTATGDSVRYAYYNANTNTFLGETNELNGGFLSFVSDSISTSQPIVIEAQSTVANCNQRFLDTIHVTVEHPKAFFHVDLINANPNEQIEFYNQSLEATNFEWTFDGSAQIGSSTAVDVSNSYSAYGQDSVHLLVWTNNFCYDSVSLLSANIFENPLEEDSCWLNKHYTEFFTNWGQVQEVAIEPSATGYFAMGNYKNGVLGTQYGIVDSLELSGAYFAKYDENGTVKWKIKTPGSAFDLQYEFFEAIENSSGEVYISAYIGNKFIDNEGDTTSMISYYSQTAKLIKLDANGKLLWYRTVQNQSAPWSLGLDQNENVFFIVRTDFNEVIWSLNDGPHDTIPLPVYPADAQFCFFKLTPQGDEIWHLPIANYANNQVGFLRVRTDSLNNIYLAGQMDSRVRVYNPGSLTTFNEECGINCGGDRFFLYKLDENGNFIWSMRALYSYNSIRPTDIAVDPAGNSYITGARGAVLTMENANGTLTGSTSGGKIFITKIDSDGITQWIECNNTGYYGGGDQLELLNDTLYVHAAVSAHSDLTINTSFLNDDGTSINLNIYEEDRILTVLDTSGYVHRVIKNGDNFGNAFGLHHISTTGYFRLPNGKNFLSKTIKPTPYLDSIYFDDFGEELFWGGIPDYQQEFGIVNAFYESCDNSYYPQFILSDTTEVCSGNSYNFPGGTEVILQDTSYIEYLIASNGFDSTIIHSIIVTYPIPLAVANIGGETLQTNQGGTYYQWLDCTTGNLITGANSYQYQYLQNGDYAVIVMQNNCTDTTGCINVNDVGLEDLLLPNIEISPNPTSGIIEIKWHRVLEDVTVSIYNTLGQQIHREEMSNSSEYSVQLLGERGVYFIELSTNDYSIRRAVVKM